MMLRADTIEGYDFHCHVDLQKDPQATIARCEAERIFTLAVTTTPKAFPRNRQWTQDCQYVCPAAGLHPELVGDRFEELPLVLSLIRETPFVGEVGMDGSPQHRLSYEKQREVFGEILKACQIVGRKVVSIHSRRAGKDVIDLIERFTTPDRVLCILHWFSDSQSLVRRASIVGCYFSVNANMLDNPRGIALIGAMPPDRILTETDTPFGATDSRQSVPWDVLQTTQRINMEANGKKVRQNADRILRFAGVID
jgi:TatD DNase family protein